MQLECHPFELRWPGEPERVLRGRVVRAPGRGSLPGVLMVHGHRGFMDWSYFPELAQRVAGAGLAAVVFNLSGSGIGPDLMTFSDERGFAANTYSRELEDLERVRAALDAGELPGHVDAGHLALYGHSRGGGMALLHAAARGDYAALALWAPMHRVALFGDESRRSFARDGYILSPLPTGGALRLDRSILDDAERNGEALDIQAACRRLRAPTLLLYGNRDRLQRMGAAGELLAAFPAGVATLRTIEGGGHTLGARHPLRGIPEALEQGLGQTVAWLTDHLARGRPRA